MRTLVLTICVFMMVCAAFAQTQDSWPAPETVIKEWKQIHEVMWQPQPQPHPYFHYHDYYYVDPSGESHVEVAGSTTMCPRIGRKPVWFVYRTRDRELRFLKFDPIEEVWELDQDKLQQWVQQWHDDFDVALKVYGETEDCGEDCG